MDSYDISKESYDEFSNIVEPVVEILPSPFYECYICDEKFKSLEIFESHVSQTHRKDEEGITCELCETEFSKLSDLNSHMADVHEYNVKQKHILVTHKGGKGHKCHICNKEFILFSELNTHLSTVHGGIKKHKCDRYVLINIA